MAKLWALYKIIKSSKVIQYFIGFISFLVSILFIVEKYIKRRLFIYKLNQHEDREEEVNKVDNNGYKQLPATGGHDSSSTPTNVNAKEKLHIEMHGTASSTNEERIKDTQNLLNELRKYEI
jgi:hypothetical protein